jgi:secreted trypsin-like serine protease
MLGPGNSLQFCHHVRRWWFGASALLMAAAIIFVTMTGHHPRRTYPPIIGGTPTASPDYSSVVYIIDTRKHGLIQCTGTVVTPLWILTAGHCGIEPGTGRSDPAGEFTVFTQLPHPARLRFESEHVTRIVVYPGYGKNILAPDAALLHLSKRVSAWPVMLDHNPSRHLEGVTAIIAGWATSVDEARLPSTIAIAGTVVQRVSWCNDHALLFGAEIDLCTIEPAKLTTGLCDGDSGGPLLVFPASRRPVEVGVASRAMDHCATQRPAIFTKVMAIFPWIHAVTGVD